MLIQRIFRNLLKPQEIPTKIIKKINFYYSLKKYNQNIFENEQNNIFNSLGLNRKQGIENLNLIKKNLNLPSNTNSGMSIEENEILFSSISINKNLQINNILEIGTYDGFNALLLSKLFPNSKIDTIDLPEDDDDFIKYGFIPLKTSPMEIKKKLESFLEKRNNHLSKNNNIKFLPLNSLKLINHKKKYDMIYIDGAHGYPVVCIDIINSLNLINDKGLIICDDIYLNLNHLNSDKMYNSIASYETLNELQRQNLIEFKLIYKRLTPKSNCFEKERKFIAILNKI